MNFFQAQDKARRNTTTLVVLFGLAVASLIVITNVLITIAVQTMSSANEPAALPIESRIFISLGVIGIVVLACLYKYTSLSGGGRNIAESMGGRLLIRNSANAQDRRVMNIVEEMAIAAGLPVPPVYIIPESSINAFAAGFSADDAVIGLNQGTIDLLNREELQGVVAHEFSHILNGDMRINLRLIALLHGILFIGMIGYGLMRINMFSRGRSNNGNALLFLGIGLTVVGYAGTFFGNLIKAAVSRQREYLADASAVQFTRSPNGIADALKKIGGLEAGSTVEQPAANEASHMFFGQIRQFFSLMATHPPLEERIQAIQPGWKGTIKSGSNSTASQPNQVSGLHAGAASESLQPANFNISAAEQSLTARIGQADLNAARKSLADLPASLTDAARDPFDARALIYALLVDHDNKIASLQLKIIENQAQTGIHERVTLFLPALAGTHKSAALTLLEIALPTLKQLSSHQYHVFKTNVLELIVADTEVDIFEWVLHRMLIKVLDAHFGGNPASLFRKSYRLRQVSNDVYLVLATLARYSPYGEAALRRGLKSLHLEPNKLQLASFDYHHINEALSRLERLKPQHKQQLVDALVETAAEDGEINFEERALLTGICATLDVPVPPAV